VAAHPGGWAHAYISPGQDLIVAVNGVESWRRPVGLARWTVLASAPDGRTAAIVTREDQGIDRAFIVDAQGEQPLRRPAYGLRPVWLEWSAAAQDWVATVSISAWEWVRVELSTGREVVGLKGFPDGDTGGMIGVQDGKPIWAYLPSGAAFERVGVRFPVEVQSGVLVGQWPGVDWVALHEAGRPRALIRGQCYEVQTVEGADGQIHVCTRRSDGAAFLSGPPWPEIEMPEFRPAGRAIGVGAFFDSEGPTICTPGSRFPFRSRAETPAVFATLGVDDVSPAVAMAKQTGLPLGCYCDGHGYDLAAVPHDAGARAWIYAYPGRRLEWADSLRKLRADIALVTAADLPFDLVCAAYCQAKGTFTYDLLEQQVIDALACCWNLAIDEGAGAVWLFARRRGDPLIDGFDFWPGLAEAVRRMRAASEDWLAFPTRQEVPINVPIPPALVSPMWPYL
jgi:hypothetical protein